MCVCEARDKIRLLPRAVHPRPGVPPRAQTSGPLKPWMQLRASAFLAVRNALTWRLTSDGYLSVI